MEPCTNMKPDDSQPNSLPVVAEERNESALAIPDSDVDVDVCTVDPPPDNADFSNRSRPTERVYFEAVNGWMDSLDGFRRIKRFLYFCYFCCVIFTIFGIIGLLIVFFILPAPAISPLIPPESSYSWSCRELTRQCNCRCRNY